MPSHIHAIIAFNNTGKTINSIVSNGKRFIAYDLVNRLEQQNSRMVLSELSSSLSNTEIKEGKLHSVFETSFDWKPAWRQTGSAEQKNSFNKNLIIRHGGQVFISIHVKQTLLNCQSNMNIAQLSVIIQVNKVFIT